MAHKIMIVDDEPPNLRILEKLFRQEYQVVTAESGAEALALLEQHDVALLISDQRMARMTGIELMKKTVALRPQMVKILLTGYTDVEALIESINSGLVYRYITKPWSNDELRIAVSRALDHYETLKSRHLVEMVNRRLLAKLNQIAELATEGIPTAVDPTGAMPTESENQRQVPRTDSCGRGLLHAFTRGAPLIVR